VFGVVCEILSLMPNLNSCARRVEQHLFECKFVPCVCGEILYRNLSEDQKEENNGTVKIDHCLCGINFTFQGQNPEYEGHRATCPLKIIPCVFSAEGCNHQVHTLHFCIC
jgi:hypothetical protein